MRNLKIIFLHILFNILMIIIFFQFEDVDIVVPLAKFFVIVILPLFYIFIGFRYVNSRGGRWEILFNISIISIIGIIIWFICLYNYITDDIEARFKRAAVPYVLPSEMQWLFYVVYNLFVFLATFSTDITVYFGKPINKYALSFSILIINFFPLNFIWIGFIIRKYIERNRGKHE